MACPVLTLVCLFSNVSLVDAQCFPVRRGRRNEVAVKVANRVGVA